MEPRNTPAQAAVLIIEHSHGQQGTHLLLTQRTAHLRQHGGEVAFPGGMKDSGDSHLQHTALRETQEEVGLAPDHLQVFGRLPRTYTRSGVEVHPYMAKLQMPAPLSLNPHEIASAFWLPQAFLLADPRQRTDVFTLNGHSFWAPAYCYEGYDIWGFTARLLVEYLARRTGVTLKRQHPCAPERHRPVNPATPDAK